MLYGLLIQLVENVASPDELHALKMNEEGFLSIPDWNESCAEKSRKITNKIKYFLESKEPVKNECEKKSKAPIKKETYLGKKGISVNAYTARWKILSYIMPVKHDFKEYSTTPSKKRKLDTISDSVSSSSASSSSSANKVKETCFSYASTLTPAPKNSYFYCGPLGPQNNDFLNNIVLEQDYRIVDRKKNSPAMFGRKFTHILALTDLCLSNDGCRKRIKEK